MAVELRVLDALGNLSEILPDWSDLTFSQDLLSPGVLTFSYPTNGRNSALLAEMPDTGVQLAVLLDGFEPNNGRFTYNEGTGSRIVDSDGQTSTYSAPSNLARFGNLMLAPAVGSQTNDDDLFSFMAVDATHPLRLGEKTAGAIVRYAIGNAMSRGAVRSANPAPWFTHPITGFTDTLDSTITPGPQPWTKPYSVTFQGGTTVLDVLTWLIDNGYAEATMDKKTLRLVEPSRNGRNLASGAEPTVLQTGRDFTQASYQTSSGDLVNALLVLGDENSCAWVYNQASIDTYGYREGTLSVSGLNSQPMLTDAGNFYLSIRSKPRWSFTYAVSALYLERTTGVPRPFIDYQVGDSILILDGVNTSVQRLRLMSATWPNSSAASVNLTVNDWFSEREVQFDQRIKRIST